MDAVIDFEKKRLEALIRLRLVSNDEVYDKAKKYMHAYINYVGTREDLEQKQDLEQNLNTKEKNELLQLVSQREALVEAMKKHLGQIAS